MISVMLPTRGRDKQLRASVASLLDTAIDPWRVEILVAVDPDERDAYERLTFPGQVRWFVAPERFGYAGLHHYFNFLASAARGDWLMLWNDDAKLVTSGWDEVVEGCEPDRCLFMDAVYPCLGQRGNIFPIWPRSWSQLMGYVSLSANNDVWISEVANRMGRQYRIPVVAVHERAMSLDADATHMEGRAAMGEGNSLDYDSRANRLERSRSVRRISSLYAAA